MGSGKSARRKNRVRATAEIPGLSAAPPPPIPSPRQIPRADLWVAVFLIVWATLFAATLLSLANGRSFHQDELHVLAVEKKAEVGIETESQHQHFHAFQHWWLKDRLNQRHARIPSIVFVTLGMISLALLAWRLGGRNAAAAAALVYTLWPRAWDDGLEMRYYGLIFLAGTLGFHALLSLARGAFLWPAGAMALLFAVMARWHPTAIPFHGALLLVAFGVSLLGMIRRLREWNTRRDPASIRALVAPSLVVAISLIVGVAVLGRVYTHLGGSAIADRFGKLGGGNYNLLDLGRWFVAWVDDRFAGDFPAIRILRLSFPVLVAVGLWRLWKSSRLLAGCGVAILVLQLALAGVFSLGWGRVVFGYKYITSSSVLLVLSVAIASAWIVEAVRRRSPRAAMGAVSVLALAYAVPVLPRVYLSATGDGSHFRQLWSRLFLESGVRPPVVYATTETTQSVRPYTVLMPNFAATVASNQVLSPDVVPSIFHRDQPGFVALDPAILARMPWKDFLTPVESYRSNFAPAWDIELMRPRGDAQIAAGEELLLDGVANLLVLEPGHWRLNGEATLSLPQPWMAGALVAVTSAMPGARLIPDYATGPVVRNPILARVGPLDADSRPLWRESRPVYTLLSNETLAYDFWFPAADSHLVLGGASDFADRDGFLVQFNGEAAALVCNIEPAASGAPFLYRIAVPAKLSGRTARVTLSRLRDSAHYLSPKKPRSALTLESVQVELATPDSLPSENFLPTLRFAARPSWAADGSYDAATDPSPWNISEPTRGVSGVTLSTTREGVRAALARDLGEQGIYTEAFPVTPGQALAVEIRLRLRHAITKSAVPFVYFLSAEGGIIAFDPIGGRPLDANDCDWTTRIRVGEAPPGTVAATIAIVFNSPPAARLREDTFIDIQGIRFLNGGER